MKYGDLIQFEPIESVVQLREPTRPLLLGGLSRPMSSPMRWPKS